MRCCGGVGCFANVMTVDHDAIGRALQTDELSATAVYVVAPSGVLRTCGSGMARRKGTRVPGIAPWPF
eukprot:3095325-Prymnesium_polylepis.1